jgi:hypothetical protein
MKVELHSLWTLAADKQVINSDCFSPPVFTGLVVGITWNCLGQNGEKIIQIPSAEIV